MITVWLLVFVCLGAACGPRGWDVRGIYATYEECRTAGEKEKWRKPVCMEGKVEDQRKS